MSESSVATLASAILDPARRQPIIVVTTPGYTTPDRIPPETLQEAEELRRAIGDIADVAIVPTGRVSFALEAQLPAHWHIFNGYCRSYPAGIVAEPDIHRSPLRRRGRDERASERVISDAFGHALASGMLHERPTGSVAHTGTVQGFLLDGERGLVDVGATWPALVWRDMTAPGIPLDWLIAKDATVPGDLDHAHNRFVLRKPPFTAHDLRKAFPHESVTLALVDRVTTDDVVLRVHPDLAITVGRDDVTSNPLDTLDLFFVEGEVVRARVVHLGTGEVRLRLSDVDDDEPVRPAIAVVEGGSPWLVEGRNLPAAPASTADDDAWGADAAPSPVTEPATGSGPSEPRASAALAGSADVPGPTPSTAAPAEAPEPPVPAASRPTPGPGPRPAVRRSPPAASPPAERPPAPESRGAVRDMSMTIAALTADNERLRREVAEAETLRSGIELSNRTLRDLRVKLAENDAKVRHFQDLHKQAVHALRASRKEQPAVQGSGPRARRADWPDDDLWVRNEILLAWVARIQAAEKRRFPLPADYAIGPRFAESLTALNDAQFGKAMKTVVDVLTGRAKDIPGRDLHRLRTGDGGDDAFVVRPDDGAVCWRAAIEIKSASARRLHYWALGGRIELSRVVLHDDMDP